MFGSVDLAPSDITAALVLAAAAQRRRRKNRIKKALNPHIKAASNAATSQTSDDLSEETASVDDSECSSPCKLHRVGSVSVHSILSMFNILIAGTVDDSQCARAVSPA